jgi:iron complex transport system substrate-binding protein
VAGAGAGAGADAGRRAVVAACVAAPLAAAVALGSRARGALVGARPFVDSRVEGAAFPRRLIGPAGEELLLPRPPARIVSTYVACEEVLAELVAIPRVVGVSVYADDPGISNVAGVYAPGVARLYADPERVLALEPDLVCVTAFTTPEALRLLSGAGVPVLRWGRLDAFADVMGGIRLLGAAVGAEARAAALVAGVEAALAGVAARVAGRRSVRVLYYDSPGYTLGPGTLVDEILTRAGGRNVAAELGIRGPAQIGIEAVLAAAPEAIVMPRHRAAVSPAATLARQPLWRGVPAVAAGRLYEVPGALMTAVSHHAAQALDRVARLLHPEA